MGPMIICHADSLELALSGTKDRMFVLRGRRSVSSWAPYPSAVLTSDSTLLDEVTVARPTLAHRSPGLQLLKRNNAKPLGRSCEFARRNRELFHRRACHVADGEREH